MQITITCSNASHQAVRKSQRQTQPTSQSLIQHNRRTLLGATLLGLSLPTLALNANAQVDEGVGVVNETLNSCTLDSQSCISTMNDDEAHFAAPWQYELPPDDALAYLIDVATGGQYEPGLIEQPFGIPRGEAASFIAKGVFSVVTNQAMPDKPKSQRAGTSFYDLFKKLSENKFNRIHFHYTTPCLQFQSLSP